MIPLDRYTLARHSWLHFSVEMPPPHVHLLVTNNLQARDAFGQMSHVWMVAMVHIEKDGEITAFTGSDMGIIGPKIRGLTHWRFALPEEGR